MLWYPPAGCLYSIPPFYPLCSGAESVIVFIAVFSARAIFPGHLIRNDILRTVIGQRQIHFGNIAIVIYA